jgi:hypothetical protein
MRFSASSLYLFLFCCQILCKVKCFLNICNIFLSTQKKVINIADNFFVCLGLEVVTNPYDQL